MLPLLLLLPLLLRTNVACTLNAACRPLIYLHTMSLSCVSGAGMLNVVSTSTLYWAGMKIFSKRKGSLENDLAVFDQWWDNIKDLRQFNRHAFLYSVPLLLFSAATTPGLWKQNLGLAASNAVVMLSSACACYCMMKRLVLMGAPKQDLAKKAKATKDASNDKSNTKYCLASSS